MSIATLKRKTFEKYNNNSVGKGFSLNGTHRSQGWIGQDSLGRSFPKTLMKGNVVKGHGGYNGSYQQNAIISSAITSLNDPSVVKPSVLDNDGMIRTKYRWIWRPQPFSTTKQDTSRTKKDQSTYITSLSVKVSNLIDASYSTIIDQPRSYYCDISNIPREARPRVNNTYFPQVIQTRNPCNYTKSNMSRPERNNPLLGILGGGYVNYVIPQSSYIKYLDNQCTPKDLSLNFSHKCTPKPMSQNLLQTALIGGVRSF
jgi:hypothetical protein